MTVAEFTIAKALESVKIRDVNDKGFVNQLKNWYNRDMTPEGYAKMIRLLDRYRKDIPDYERMKTASIDEQINKLGV